MKQDDGESLDQYRIRMLESCVGRISKALWALILLNVLVLGDRIWDVLRVLAVPAALLFVLAAPVGAGEKIPPIPKGPPASRHLVLYQGRVALLAECYEAGEVGVCLVWVSVSKTTLTKHPPFYDVLPLSARKCFSRWYDRALDGPNGNEVLVWDPCKEAS